MAGCAHSRHQHVRGTDQHPMPAVVHLICRADKSTTFEFDQDVNFNEPPRSSARRARTSCSTAATAGSTEGEPLGGHDMRRPPASVIAWRITTENEWCIALTNVYYDHSAAPAEVATRADARRDGLSATSVCRRSACRRSSTLTQQDRHNHPGGVDVARARSPVRTVAVVRSATQGAEVRPRQGETWWQVSGTPAVRNFRNEMKFVAC